MENFLNFIFFSVFTVLLLVMFYVIYYYFNFKSDISQNVEADTIAIKKFEENYEKNKTVFTKLNELVQHNKDALSKLDFHNKDSKKVFNDLITEHENNLNTIDTLLKTYKNKIEIFNELHNKQKSSYIYFENEENIKMAMKKIEQDLNRHVRKFVFVNKEVYKIFDMFRKLDVEHNAIQNLDIEDIEQQNESIISLTDDTININTSLLTLLESNDELQNMIDEYSNTIIEINSPLEKSSMTLVDNYVQNNKNDGVELLTKFYQNRHEIDLLKTSLNYTQDVLQNIDDKLKDVVENTNNVLGKMNDLELQASTFQTRLENLNENNANIREMLQQNGLNIDQFEQQLEYLEKRNVDIQPLLSEIVSVINNNQISLNALNNKDRSINQSLQGLESTNRIINIDMEYLTNSKRNSLNKLNTLVSNVSGIDRSLKHAFEFRQGGQEISDSLSTYSFTNGSKDLNFKRKTNMNRGMTINTPGQNNMKVCKDDSQNCMTFDVSGNDFNVAPYNNVNNFMINKSGQSSLVNFDLANENIYIGGINDDATLTIKDENIVFQDLVLNGEYFCKL